jgi:hypothetical protein
MEDGKQLIKRLARTSAERGDPHGWFEEFYALAEGDINRVYWADLAPNPLLLAWLESEALPVDGRAVTIGCGLGDDAEAIAARGLGVTAFDISASAIAMCRDRYPGSPVAYEVRDLFDLPRAWQRAFDLVYECNTIQILDGEFRTRARDVIAELVAPRGVAIVSCRSREPDEKLDEFPLPLDRDEIDGFRRSGLVEERFVAYDDDQDPPVPHFFAVYRRP